MFANEELLWCWTILSHQWQYHQQFETVELWELLTVYTPRAYIISHGKFCNGSLIHLFGSRVGFSRLADVWICIWFNQIQYNVRGVIRFFHSLQYFWQMHVRDMKLQHATFWGVSVIYAWTNLRHVSLLRIVTSAHYLRMMYNCWVDT